MDLDYRLIDIDNHYYEPYDAFTRHMEPEFRDHAVHIRPGKNGLGQIWIGDRRLASASVTQTDWIGAPGSLRAYFAGMEEKHAVDDDEGGARIGGLQDVTVDPKVIPEFMNRDARLAKMDEQNLEAVLMLPTLGCTVEYELGDDAKVAAANMRAFNRWLEEDWGYGADGKIYGVPILTLIDLDWACAELERVADLGAKMFWISHHPVNGRSFADPYFDPFWARVQERGLKLAFHTGFEGFTYHYGAMWGEDPKRALPQWSAFQHYIGTGTRPITDAFASLILHNLFGRFPGIEAVSIECGSRWVPRLLEELDKAAMIGAMGIQLGGAITEKPSEIFRRHVYINPFWEEPIDELIDAIGADRILFGSDFPHPEGLSTPLDKAEELAKKVSAEDFQKIMRGNALALLNG